MSEGLHKLEEELKEELETLEFPPAPWLLTAPPGVIDVAIVGGGMAGLTAAFALLREGISNIKIFDCCRTGYEGPWDTYARMLTLRSGKALVGPALGVPKLTFRAWYTAQHGKQAWEELYKIPTKQWMEYLRWYKRVLGLPVENEHQVTLIAPIGSLIQLKFAKQPSVFAHKVVYATGRSGFGGLKYPAFVQQLPKELYAHTSELIDFSRLIGKRVCIVGAGASAFDAAATALQAGAEIVFLLERRKKIPFINKFAGAYYRGFGEGYCELPDVAKVKIMQNALENGSPPPFESLDRIKHYSNFKVVTGFDIQRAESDGKAITFTTSKGSLTADFLIVATGFEIDGAKQPELKAIIDDVLLWKNRIPELPASLGNAPYLGRHFQFLEKVPEATPYLKNIYCFNFAATLSQGITSGDIPEISTGASRLAKGIVADFFTQHWPVYVKRFQDYDFPEIIDTNYPFFTDSW